MRPYYPIRTVLTAAVLAATAFLAFAPKPVAAQRTLDRPLRVFLDCRFFCDLDYFTEDVPWVNFVRDRQDADVHMLGTRQSTSGGASFYTLEFRGLGVFEGEQITLTRTTPGDATEDARRETISEGVQRGLVPFAEATPDPPRVEILPPRAPNGEVVAAVEEDPWDRWTFTTRVNGFLNGESQQRFSNVSGGVSAQRVTDTWKTEFNLSGSAQESRFEYEIEGEPIVEVSTIERYSGSALAVRSLGGDHWALGGLASWRRDTFQNFEHTVRLAPAVEYNVIPYRESNRRLFTVLYGVGLRYNEYEEITLFRQTEEALIEQNMIVSYDVTQPWGSVDLSLSGNHFITRLGDGPDWPDPQFNLDLGGGMNLRLIRGLSFNVGGSIAMVRGQIGLRGGELTEAEILTRQRELATDYRYFMHFGLSYRFGSIFTNVVNDRMEGLRRLQ